MYYEVMCDYETSKRCGAGGCFQVISITDGDGKDCTNLIDQGTHYHNLDELKEDIAKATGQNKDDIDLDEMQ